MSESVSIAVPTVPSVMLAIKRGAIVNKAVEINSTMPLLLYGSANVATKKATKKVTKKVITLTWYQLQVDQVNILILI